MQYNALHTLQHYTRQLIHSNRLKINIEIDCSLTSIHIYMNTIQSYVIPFNIIIFNESTVSFQHKSTPGIGVLSRPNAIYTRQYYIHIYNKYTSHHIYIHKLYFEICVALRIPQCSFVSETLNESSPPVYRSVAILI